MRRNTRFPLESAIKSRIIRKTDQLINILKFNPLRYSAWHSSDMRYWFGTLANCWRPFTLKDYSLSAQMIKLLCHFAKSGKLEFNFNKQAAALAVVEADTPATAKAVQQFFPELAIPAAELLQRRVTASTLTLTPSVNSYCLDLEI